MSQIFAMPGPNDEEATAITSMLPDALATLRTFFSGPTEPASKVAGQPWADTTAGMLKIRNQANSAWLDWFPLGQTRLIQLTDPDWSVASLSATRTAKIGIGSGAGTVVSLIVLCETASTSSSGNEWQPMVKKYPNSAPGSPVDLFSGTVGTFTVLGGVGGGAEFVSSKAMRFTANQNAAFVDLDAFELVMTKAGTATTLTNFRALVEVK